MPDRKESAPYCEKFYVEWNTIKGFLPSYELKKEVTKLKIIAIDLLDTLKTKSTQTERLCGGQGRDRRQRKCPY